MSDRRLSNIDEVVAELGGVMKVARLTGRTHPAITQWRKKGRIPCALYPMLVDILLERGCYISRDLFAFEKPPTVIDNAA